MSELQPISINGPTNIDLEVSSTTTQAEEKSTFERAIIEAFKQQTSTECIKKLSIAYDEINFLVDEVKKAKGKKNILNKNLIDKLSRIAERKFFNVNILIAKIYDSLLETSNFDILSNDLNLMISFSNEVLNILEIIRSTNISHNLEKKCSCFLRYLLNNPSLENEQKEIIQELYDSFPTRNSSETYKNFESTKNNIISMCKSSLLETKLEGIITLMEAFGNTYSLDEQFDLLLSYCPAIIKAAIHQPNPENHKLYYQLGNFIISMLYSYKFKVSVIADPQNESKASSKAFYLIDDKSNDEKKEIKENECSYMQFLQDKLYELTSQKEALIKCENIVSICNLIVNTLSIYETIFDLQFLCYLILKKIFFTFPKHRKQIEDLIAMTLVNLCMFKKPEEKNVFSVECKQFLHYILNMEGEDDLKAKLNKRIESKGKDCDITLEEKFLKDTSAVEYDVLNFNDFNLRVGYPTFYDVEAGTTFERYIEVENPNSLIYIGFATHAYDIGFDLLKYEENEGKGSFKRIFFIKKIDCSEIPVKVVVFAKEAGIYKILFDNSFSWITSKTVRYRISVLKPLSEIDINKGVEPKKTEEKKEEETISINIEEEKKDKKDKGDKIK